MGLSTLLTKFRIWIASLLDVGIKVRTMRGCGHETGVDRSRNTRVTVKPSVQELDLKGASVGVVTDSAKVARGYGNSVHGEPPAVIAGE